MSRELYEQKSSWKLIQGSRFSWDTRKKQMSNKSGDILWLSRGEKILTAKNKHHFKSSHDKNIMVYT